jgi:hypothetical protein
MLEQSRSRALLSSFAQREADGPGVSTKVQSREPEPLLFLVVFRFQTAARRSSSTRCLAQLS